MRQGVFRIDQKDKALKLVWKIDRLDDILLHHPHHNLSRLFAHIGDLCCQCLPFSKDWNEDVPKPPIQNLAYRSFFLLVIYLIRDGPLHPFEIIAQAT